MKTFKNLVFKGHPNFSVGFGTQAEIFFPNGYGVSVITGQSAYSSEEAPYELAVLKGNKKEAFLTYTTPVTDDVIGHLTEDGVTKNMKAVQGLPKA